MDDEISPSKNQYAIFRDRNQGDPLRGRLRWIALVTSARGTNKVMNTLVIIQGFARLISAPVRLVM